MYDFEQRLIIGIATVVTIGTAVLIGVINYALGYEEALLDVHIVGQEAAFKRFVRQHPEDADALGVALK